MTRLPYDDARCVPEIAGKCPLPCARKQPGRPGYQAYAAFHGGDQCHGFIEDKSDDD
jgi:hypothetical protein